MKDTDSIKKILLFGIPVSICNFKCHYCYLAQRKVSFQGLHPELKYSPEEFKTAMSAERIGGLAYANFCADGETLLVKDIDQYVKAFVEQGHYAEVVTNLSVTQVLDRFLSWDRELLSRLEFKCSFHYLELKKKGLLDTFASNVKHIWQAGASATIEITPSDELIPYIEEVMAFSKKHFGALPHLTIARNDRTETIDYLTQLSMEEYDRTWSQFDSNLWSFKKTIFGVKQHNFCYAGAWSLYINLCSGEARACYYGGSLGDVFADPTKPLPEKPIGKCPIAHCYNGHAFLTFGLIPNATNVRYADVRNRICSDGREWLQPPIKAFFGTQLIEQNRPYSSVEQFVYRFFCGTKKKTLLKKTTETIIQGAKHTMRGMLGDSRYERIKEFVRKK